jgi:hypothetical protein
MLKFTPRKPKTVSPKYAASTLIDCLTLKGDFCNVEFFAQMTLDSLKDPKNGLDQQSEAVANSYYDLANVIFEKREDLAIAEKLLRESIRIRVLINSNGHHVGNTVDLLASVLRIQGKLGSETKELLKRSLANSIRKFWT